MPSVSWQTVVIGDPLCAPFGPRTVPMTELNPAVDSSTELPGFFGPRRVGALAAMGAKKEATAWLAQSDVRLAKKDFAAARQSLEEATKIDPDYTPAQLTLALIYQQEQDWPGAIDRYQRVIAKNPTQFVALNNLANALVISKNDLTGALPLARRAYLASIKNPTVSDTLAWIYHLMGDDATAEPIMTVAAQRLPDEATVQLHAAVILAGTGKMAAAAQRLESAIQLDPTLESHEEVTQLRNRLRPAK
jgi:tetratricopeptide (TPR) repeat protein